MHDVVIRNGTLIDGTGAPRFVGDIAIDGDKISQVGGEVGPAKREVDAKGMLVTPGWVDMHTHYDGQVTWDPYFTPSGWHGVTTVIMGNCGVGFAPVAEDRREWVIGLMEGVEDIPGSALSEGIRWSWETFPEYLDAIEAMPHAVDFATQVPHGPLRTYVMGERAVQNEAATPEDVAQMRDLTAEALRAGALGFSTSRTLLHKDSLGRLVPGTFAAEGELTGIADAIEEVGYGVLEFAIEHSNVPEEIGYLREIAKKTKNPVVFNLSQFDQAPELWKDLVKELDRAHAEGLPLYAQCAGRAIGVLMNWQCTAHPFALHPVWLGIFHDDWDSKLAKLRDPEFRAQLLADTPLDVGEFEIFVTRSYHKMYRLSEITDYEPDPSQSVAAIAEREGRHPLEVAYDIMMEDDGKTFLYFPLFNYADDSLDVLHELHQHPQTRMGLSDGGAHCGAICDSGMPTFMASFWTRDRKRGPTLGLEYMVMRQTSQTAQFYGLNDRGILAPGYRADINIIDYDNLGIEAPELRFDLPAGGRRLIQKAKGYKATMVAGEFIFEDGQATGAMPGKLIRGPQGAPQRLAAK